MNRLPPHEDQRVELYDAKTEGLAILLGSKTRTVLPGLCLHVDNPSVIACNPVVRDAFRFGLYTACASPRWSHSPGRRTTWLP